VLEEELDARRTKKVLLFNVSQGVVRETLGHRTRKAHGARAGQVGRQRAPAERRRHLPRRGDRRLTVRVGRLLGDLSVRLQ
jgi:hypothetical protein